MKGKLIVVGIGPGSPHQLTPAAREAIEGAGVILGYHTYLELIASLAPGVRREASGMRDEIARVQRALDLAAAGESVALVSGGDPGVYGMAGLAFEVLERREEYVPVEIIPGITALNAAAALLGAPLMGDFAAISLSDQLVPLDGILRRLELAAQADFVLGLYNPKGKRRVVPFQRACEILSCYRSPETPVGIVRAAYRPDQEVEVTTLCDLPSAEVDMRTVVIVGNSQTYLWQGRMLTPRGYAGKYDLDGKREEEI